MRREEKKRKKVHFSLVDAEWLDLLNITRALLVMVEMRSLGKMQVGGKVRKPPSSFTALIQHIPRLRRQQGNCDRILTNQSSEDKVRES